VRAGGGELVELKRKQAQQGKVTFTNTKSKKNRTVPVSDDLFQEIESHTGSDRLFKNTMDSFRDVVKECNLNLPKGQLTHVLRHTFASHFIMNGCYVPSYPLAPSTTDPIYAQDMLSTTSSKRSRQRE